MNGLDKEEVRDDDEECTYYFFYCYFIFIKKDTINEWHKDTKVRENSIQYGFKSCGCEESEEVS